MMTSFLLKIPTRTKTKKKKTELKNLSTIQSFNECVTCFFLQQWGTSLLSEKKLMKSKITRADKNLNEKSACARKDHHFELSKAWNR